MAYLLSKELIQVIANRIAAIPKAMKGSFLDTSFSCKFSLVSWGQR
jgi:hypothetical protein